MKRSFVFLSAFLLSLPITAQEIVECEPVSPLQYQKTDGKLQVLSYVLTSSPLEKGAGLYLDGEPVQWDAGSRDSLTVWLPLIGKENLLEIRKKKAILSAFRVQAPIDSDWGYFSQGEICLVQSSHQDIAWMDTPDYCRTERINDIILPALELMREDPDFSFEMEQSLNLMEFLQEHPEYKEELIQRYAERRFFWGATFNQPYEGLSSGEQLVRQAYFGRKWIKDNLPGCDDRTAFNVDVPGRALQMPQILAKSGIRNLFISRFGEGFYDWNSPDGSSVLTYSPGNYGWATLEWKFFDGDVLSAFRKMHARLGLWDEYYKEHRLPPLYCVVMSCDATKPRSYTAIFKEWNTIAELSEVPLPRVRYSNMDTFLEATDVPGVQRESISGERPNLWIYIHGPAHYEETLDKRRAAVLLPTAELLSSVNTVLYGADYPHRELSRGWMASIYPDHGLGGKNGHITDRIFADSLAVGRAVGEQVLQEQMERLASEVNAGKDDLIVFNDLPFERTALVKHPADGKEFMATLPPMGYASFKGADKKTAYKPEVRCGDNFCENAYYDISFGPGGITRLWDKELGKDVMEGEKYAFGDIYHVPYTGNGAGEFTRITELSPYGGKAVSAENGTQWKLIDNNELYSVFESSTITDFTKVIQHITVHHWTKKIDFDVTLENFSGEHNMQYRILFPLKMKLGHSDIRYEVPAAISQVGRDELDRIPMGWAGWGSYVHHPADTHPREIVNFISASGEGMGVTMSSTVVAADWLDPAREIADYTVLQGILLSSHKSCHPEGNWYSQEGTHQFHFSISTHAEGWKNGYRHGIQENHPFYVCVKQKKGGSLPASASLVTLSDPFVSIMAFKIADSGEHAVILRLVEMEGVDKEVNIGLPFPVKRVVRCSAIEEEQSPILASGTMIRLPIGHHAIETYKLFY